MYKSTRTQNAAYINTNLINIIVILSQLLLDIRTFKRTQLFIFSFLSTTFEQEIVFLFFYSIL